MAKLSSTTKSFYVGRNDGTGKVFRFATLQEAEAKIAELEIAYPVEVHNGDFYIDAPEGWR